MTLTLADEVDCARGDVIAAADDPPQAADQFEADLVWMAEEELVPGRGYWLKLGTRTVNATVQAPKYALNVNTQEHLAAKTLASTTSASSRSRPTTDRRSSPMRRAGRSAASS